MSMRFDNEHRESPESIESALQDIHTKGDKKKRVRRTAGGAVGLVAAAGIATASLTGGATGPTLAAPENTPTLDLVSQVSQQAAKAMITADSVSASAFTKTSYLDSTTGSIGSYTDDVNYAIAEDGSYAASTTSTFPREGGTQESFSSRESWDADTAVLTSCAEGSCTKYISQPNTPSPFGEFNAVIGLATADGAARVTEVTDNGYDTYRLEFTTKQQMSDNPRHIVVNIDRETGLPVKLVSTTTEAGVSYQDSEVTLTDLEVNPELTDADINVTVPAGTVLNDQTADSKVSYGESVSASLRSKLPVTKLDGFGNTRVFTYADAVTGRGACAIEYADGSMSGNDGTADYAAQSASQGTLSFGSEIYSLDACATPLNAPDDIEDFNNARVVETFTAETGALAGAKLEIYRVTSGGYVLFGQNDDFLVRASGSLTVDQFVELANNYELN